jgi:hypothetical protein
MTTLEIILQPEQAFDEPQRDECLKNHPELKGKKFSIRKRSLDARHGKVKVVLLVDVWNDTENRDEEKFERHCRNVSSAEPVFIAGSGPAGLFAALQLVESGLKPVIIERGKEVRERRRDLALITKQGIVNPDSNYCFGEGGAGTYSDGKLYTRSGKRGSIQRILNTFIFFGADKDLAIDAHPHIGTNKLPGIITAMRKHIIDCGGEFLFNTRLTGITVENKKLKAITLCNSSGTWTEKIRALILATGHSARDVFEMLQQSHLLIEAKPMAMGVRIEHQQSLIDRIQYHCQKRSDFLPPASYSLKTQTGDRGVYSFCMCPGGIIAPAATAPGEVVVNGWSPSKRNNPFSNSGIVVTVTEADVKRYSKYGALRFMQLQKAVEQMSFKAGGGTLFAPAQRLVDFTQGKFSGTLPLCSYKPGLTSSPVTEIFPAAISQALKAAFKDFGKKMKGYFTNEAVLVATESRTSSPVRIPRDEKTGMHPGCEGLFPCGEGAGYAGGIVSAAMDGEKSAVTAKRYLRPDSD